ncbi:transglutaminase domain-containing protein [Flavobacterium sp.]|uniref:transglutaminase domain-containing protein n=1 Tax=Flavobacterium sp. TaxID=239 RepID=UPI0025C72FD7|nr:transglutaminase domain-containing protein [Flavobacterium sp.]
MLFVGQSVLAQDYAAVDQKVFAYPTSFASPEKLADKVNLDFSSETQKARAIYAWIAKNVSYDLAEFRSNQGGRVAFSYRTPEEKEQKLQKYNLDLANKTMRSRKGVCRGYTALYDRVATLCGLEAITIPGTSKSHPTHIGKLPTSADHIWNAVKIGGKWQLIDVTWASGSVDSQSGKFVNKFNAGYFFTNPDVFFLNHFPDEQKWLPVNKTAEEFAGLPLYSGEYIDADYKITFPKSGILPNGYVIPFKIENLDTDRVAYALSSDGKIHVADVRKNGKISEFDVPLAKNASGFLTIFVNHESVATYRIKKS